MSSAYLREARTNLSEAAENVCADEILDFEELLSHNEFELALDAIETAFFKSRDSSWRVLENMALSAFNIFGVFRVGPCC